MNFFCIALEIKLNTVIVEGSYMSGIPVNKTCTNPNSLVAKVFIPFGQHFLEAPFVAMTATSLFGVSTIFAQ